MLPIVIFIFIAIQLLFVAYIDFKTKKISNLWVVINAITFVILTLIFPTIYLWSFKAFIFPAVFFIVGFGLFLLNIMGGGDSKYLASLYLLIPINFQDETFIYLLYATILVGGSLFLYNLLKNIDKIINDFKIGNIHGVKKVFGKKFTFAPVIFIAWMWFGWQNYKLLTF